MRAEHYLSIDVEADGPVPGLNSLLSIGAVHFDNKGKVVSTFSCNLKELEGATPNPDTMVWWQTQPKAWEATRANAIDPKLAICSFAAWLPEEKLIPLAWPAAFDHAYINWYGWKFLGKFLIGFSCLDVRSFFMGVARRRGYFELKEAEVYEIFGHFDKSKYREHVAVDDALSTGEMFFHVRNNLKKLTKIDKLNLVE